MNDFEINITILHWQPMKSIHERTLSKFHRDIICSFLLKAVEKNDRLELSISVHKYSQNVV